MSNLPITGNFKVDGLPFVEWFNTTQAPVQAFYQYKGQPIRVENKNFAQVMYHLKWITGKEAISLGEFCGHFAIIYNETGGTFRPLREFGGADYMFNAQNKQSYNQAPNRLAGNQLKDWGVISSAADVTLWNGHLYPTTQPAQVKKAAEKCDFYRFRGYGLNQLTWRSNYQKCLQPLLPKLIDDYDIEEFERVIMDFKIVCGTFYNYINQNATFKRAIQQLAQGKFTPYGQLVSGSSSYTTQIYLPRCQHLFSQLKNKQLVPFQDIRALLTIEEVKKVQQAILDSGNEDAKALIRWGGGADGWWGAKTQKAFDKLHTSLEVLLGKEEIVIPARGLVDKQVTEPTPKALPARPVAAHQPSETSGWFAQLLTFLAQWLQTLFPKR